MPLQIMITDAGLDAIVNAQLGATEAVVISQIGLTATPFLMAPTIDALPGEFRRLATVAGQAVAENILHVTAYDAEPISYDVTGFGLYDADEVLLAVYSEAAEPLLTKAALAYSLFAIDIALEADQAAVIEFGDPQFLNPPATETVKGVAEIADNGEADAGDDDTRIMTPKKVRRVLDALRTWLFGVDFTGAGLAIVTGDLEDEDGVSVDVPAASQEEVTALAIADKAVTPESLLGLFTMPSGGSTDEWRIGRFHFRKTQISMSANSTSTASFGSSFPNACLFAVATGGMAGLSQDSNNGFVPAGGWNASGATIQHPGNAGATFSILAIGY